ncbi:hypothetical protein AAMO2058_001690900 [Amorphochlora amoebiformis]
MIVIIKALSVMTAIAMNLSPLVMIHFHLSSIPTCTFKKCPNRVIDRTPCTQSRDVCLVSEWRLMFGVRRTFMNFTHPLPLAMIACNASIWGVYALLKEDYFPLFATNLVSGIGGWTHLMVFKMYSSEKPPPKYDIMPLILMVILVQFMAISCAYSMELET